MPQQKRRHLLTAETNFKCCKFHRGQIKLLLMLRMAFIASPFSSLTNTWSPLSLPLEDGAIVVHRKVFFSSVDGYKQRFDAILADFPRKEWIINNTLHYDTDLKEHWRHTTDFLNMVGKAGIVLNLKKFQFAQRDVEFASFHISDHTIDPFPKYLNAIRDFLTPSSTSEAGLICQSRNELCSVVRSHETFSTILVTMLYVLVGWKIRWRIQTIEVGYNQRNQTWCQDIWFEMINTLKTRFFQRRYQLFFVSKTL